MYNAAEARLRTKGNAMENTTDTTAFDNADILVAKNECYELIYSKLKNRVYLTIIGFWKNKECVPDFLKDWDKVLVHVKPDFTILTDMRTMITHPPSLKSIHTAAQLKVKAAGVLQVANIMPIDRIASLQIGTIAATTNLPTTNFTTLQEAELWLDRSVSLAK